LDYLLVDAALQVSAVYEWTKVLGSERLTGTLLARVTHRTIGVIMLDVDHFKQVNDTYGHLAGDHVLVEAARRMQEAVRSYDLVGRYGGEEFLVVSPDCDREQIQICAERIRSAMAEQPVRALDSSIAITVSAGTAVLVPRLNSEKEALAAADSALYRAKSGGRNQVAS
jgi:two-component system cell cycle response regulator